LPLRTQDRHFGFLVVKVQERERYEPYAPFVGNLANGLAVNIERQWRKNGLDAANAELLRHREHLEDLVQERTAEVHIGLERIQHLNNVLHAIRSVNQLIVREKDPAHLIQQACKLLVETRGYRASWIALRQGGAPPSHMAQAGWGETFGAFGESLRHGRLPSCWSRARAAENGLAVLDPREDCRECSLRQAYGHDGAGVAALRHDARDFGTLGICLAPGGVVDDEERSLLVEVAGDLGLALHAIVADKGRAESEDALHIKNQVFEDSISSQSIADKDGVITIVNRAFLRMWGYASKEEAVGKSVASFFADPADATPVLEALAAHDAWEGRFLARRTDGSTFTSHGYATSLRGPAGQLEGYQSTNLDVTPIVEFERQLKVVNEDLARSNDALRESKEYLDEAQRIAHLGSWQLDVASNQVVWSDELYRMYGFDPALPPPHYTESQKLFTPESWDRLSGAIEHARATGISYELELEIVRKDGAQGWMWARGEAVLDASGATVGLRGVTQDITARKRAERALTIEKANLDALFESSPIALLLLDATTQIVRVNEAAVALTGGSEAEFLQHRPGNALRCVHSTKDPRGCGFAPECPLCPVRNGIEALIKSGGSMHGAELPLELKRSGAPQQVWMHLGAEAVMISGARHLLVAMDDVTDRKQAALINTARLHLIEFAAAHSLDELLEETLNEAEKLSGSVIGFYHFVEADQVSLTLQNWSTRTKAEFCRAEGKGKGSHYGIDKAGVWVDCVHQRKPVIHNDYAALPHRKGMPEGHAVVIRQLVVPVMQGEQVMAILGVGNKPGDYTPVDVALVSELAGLAWHIAVRKRAEEALQENQALLAQAEEMGKVGGWEFDIETKLQTWTKAVYDIHELASTGRPTVDQGVNFYTPASRPIIERAVQRAIEQGEPFDVELEIITAKGNLRSVHAVGKADPARRRISGFFQDITDRKRAEAALRQSSERLSLATIAGGVGIWELDVVNNKLTWDAQMFRLYGITSDDFGGAYETWKAGVHPEDVARGDAEVQMALRGEKEFDTEFRVLWPSGTIRHLAARAQVHRNAVGQPTKLIGTNYDITERKQAEEEIRTLNAELEQRVLHRTAQLQAANEELEAYSYSVSHDLRAPLRHVQGYVDMLGREAGGQLSEEGRRYLKTIADASGEMGVLIDDLLAFSRMGRAEMLESSVDLDALVRETRRDLEPVTRGRNIVWTIAPLPAVQADPAMLKLVLANLLGNAAKFTRPRDPALIEMGSAGTEDGRVILFLRDNGVGFDPHYADKLFGVFQRLHRTDEFEGTGIGLANVRRIIARHGGRTWAEGAEDKGATFYFTLRAAN
jgi:PAS domain S-box-containing protein